MSTVRERLCWWAFDGTAGLEEGLLDALIIDPDAMVAALQLLDELRDLGAGFEASADADGLTLIESLLEEAFDALAPEERMARAMALAIEAPGPRAQALLQPLILGSPAPAGSSFEEILFAFLFEDAPEAAGIAQALDADPSALQRCVTLLDELPRLAEGVAFNPAAQLALEVDVLGRLEDTLEQWLEALPATEAQARLSRLAQMGPRAAMLLGPRIAEGAAGATPIIPELLASDSGAEILTPRPPVWRRGATWMAVAAVAAAAAMAVGLLQARDAAEPGPAPVGLRAAGAGGRVGDGGAPEPSGLPELDATAYRPAMLPVPAGVFQMGSPATEAGRGKDEVRHGVEITRPYWMARTEVTQGQWSALMKTAPSKFGPTLGGTPAHPVEQLSWADAAAYMNALSAAEDLGRCYTMSGCKGQPGAAGYACERIDPVGPRCEGYRLPTEAEWERAARGGEAAATYAGELALQGERDAPVLDPIAWYSGNSGVDSGGLDCSRFRQTQHPATRCGTHPVALKRPNAYGLHDMIGNVWEWTADYYAPDYGGVGLSPLDPEGPPEGARRVTKGCGWFRIARFCRAANRYRPKPGYRSSVLGLRPARSISPGTGAPRDRQSPGTAGQNVGTMPP